jgi:hypothetical protein
LAQADEFDAMIAAAEMEDEARSAVITEMGTSSESSESDEAAFVTKERHRVKTEEGQRFNGVVGSLPYEFNGPHDALLSRRPPPRGPHGAWTEMRLAENDKDTDSVSMTSSPHMDKKREYEQRQEALRDVTLRRQHDLVKFIRRRDLIERHNEEQRRGPAPLTEISLLSDEDSPQRKHDKPTATPIATPPPSSNTWLGGFHEYLHGTEKVRTEEAEEGLRAAVRLL